MLFEEFLTIINLSASQRSFVIEATLTKVEFEEMGLLNIIVCYSNHLISTTLFKWEEDRQHFKAESMWVKPCLVLAGNFWDSIFSVSLTTWLFFLKRNPFSKLKSKSEAPSCERKTVALDGLYLSDTGRFQREAWTTAGCRDKHRILTEGPEDFSVLLASWHEKTWLQALS